LRAFVIGTPGVLDPRTGGPRLAVNLPAWHEGVLAALRSDLGRPVTIENDVNLAAMAERPAGAAGEIGYLPVPGVPLPQDVTHPATGAFQSLVGAQAVRPLAASYGFAGPAAAAASRPRSGRPPPATARERVYQRACWSRGDRRRAATGVVLDRGLVVLGGEAGLAGGAVLADRVATEVRRICPAGPQVVPTGVSGGVVRGAILAAVDQARAGLPASVAGPGKTKPERVSSAGPATVARPVRRRWACWSGGAGLPAWRQTRPRSSRPPFRALSQTVRGAGEHDRGHSVVLQPR
jgi:hypothetical protein